MTEWLAPIKAALAEGDDPVQVFVRDDDAGWHDARLFGLLDVFERAQFPIDVAAIPAHVSVSCAAELNRRRARHPTLRVHQHGYAHVNHEIEGRKCEFGASRDTLRQRADIRQGRDRLCDMLGDSDLVFTPPWNRCSQATVDALQAEGFRILSRDHGATPLDLGRLAHVPVTIDWRKKRDDVRDTPAQTAAAIAAQIRTGQRHVGLMLHHETLEAEDLSALAELLVVMRGQPRARCVNIVDFGDN